jgi:arginyl-tRNA synthetase
MNPWELTKKELKEVISKKYNIILEDVLVEHPAEESFGDLASNVALTLAKDLSKSPMTIAEEICNELNSKDIQWGKVKPFEKIYAAKPGFINFVFSPAWLISAASADALLEKGSSLKGKKILVEYTDPNPFKVIHIGHLMSNTLGEAISGILDFQGAEVIRANYQGDVGLHVAKSLWGFERLLEDRNTKLEDLEKLSLQEKAKFLGEAYALGASAYEEKETRVEEAKEIEKINRNVYSSNLTSLRKSFYDSGKRWSLDYFETVYDRLGTKFDHYFFESEVWGLGLKEAQKLLGKGLLEESDGAVVFRGEKYGLHTRVFVSSQGVPTYESKDLGLALEKERVVSPDTSIVVTANEQADYFKVVFKLLELYQPAIAKKTKHLPHGMMKLASGKMSSRTGDVISGEDFLDKTQKAVMSRMGDELKLDSAEKKEEVADKIAVASVKYSVLKGTTSRDIIYNEEEALSLAGNTGPYLLYTYARSQSLLEKAGTPGKDVASLKYEPNEKEMAILRVLYRFPSVASEAASEFSPSTISTYVFDLAQRLNTFYSEVPVIKAETEEIKEFRLFIVKRSAEVIKKSLELLGIPVVSRM